MNTGEFPIELLELAEDGRSLDGIDDNLARDWSVWSMVIGRTMQPVLERLKTRLPNLTSAMLCTADGFNVCSLGVEESQVARLAALSSSLYSISGAAVDAVADAENEALDMVNLASGDSQIVVIGQRHELLGHLLLWVAAERSNLGLMLVSAKAAAAEIRKLFEAESGGTATGDDSTTESSGANPASNGHG